MPLLPFLNQLIAGFYSLFLFHVADPKPATGTYPARDMSPKMLEFTGVTGIIPDSDISPEMWALTGNCDARYFHKILRAEGGKSIMVNDLFQQPDGSFLLAGSIDNNFSNVDALLIKTDSSGNPLWQKSFDQGSNDSWLRMARKQDGNFILAGENNGEQLIVSEVNPDGNIIWTKQVSDNKLSLYDMILDDDGSILLTGTRFDLLDQSAAFFIKLSSSGTKIWSSIYDNPGSDLFLEIAQDAGGYYVTGTSRSAPSNALITRLDRSNGAVTWSYQYDLEKRMDVFQQLHVVNNKLIVNGYTRSLSTPIYNRQVNGVVGNDGSLNEVKIFSNNIFNSDILQQDDGSYIIVQSSYLADAFVNVFRFDASDKMVWGRKKYVDVNRAFPFIQASNNGGYILTSVERNSLGGSAFLVHMDSNGLVPVCQEINASETVSTMGVTRLPFQFASVSDQEILIEDISLPASPEEIGGSGYCTSNCTSFNIVGDTAACIGSNQGVYRIERNEGCDLPVTWHVDASFATVQSQNDSMITLDFKEIGAFTLSASMETNCSTISDEHKIQVYVPLSNVNLNKDHYLCKGEYISFYAPGYKNYLWSTGSRENSVIVNQPGTYHLTVEDFCGNKSSDTIEVFMANETFVNLGPDTTVCSYDPIELNAGDGYKSYLWQNGSNAQKLKVSAPGEYSIMVTNEFGCRAFDTIRVAEGNCFRGISFPNAFSPNGDGKNDVFRPAVYSVPEYYELLIYNRWGQLVFQTRDPQKGWDGKLKNQVQEQQSFIYSCIYKFRGAAEQRIKGSFTIIK